MTQDVYGYLSKYGIKPSMQRVAVMEYLMTHATHPTADEIYVALSPSMPTLSKTTVYNTLKLLAAHGAILLLDIDERNARFDGDTSPHAHFWCRGCGMVRDLPMPVAPEELVLNDSRFEVDDMQVYYKGYCPKCSGESD